MQNVLQNKTLEKVKVHLRSIEKLLAEDTKTKVNMNKLTGRIKKRPGRLKKQTERKQNHKALLSKEEIGLHKCTANETRLYYLQTKEEGNAKRKHENF